MAEFAAGVRSIVCAGEPAEWLICSLLGQKLKLWIVFCIGAIDFAVPLTNTTLNHILSIDSKNLIAGGDYHLS